MAMLEKEFRINTQVSNEKKNTKNIYVHVQNLIIIQKDIFEWLFIAKIMQKKITSIQLNLR